MTKDNFCTECGSDNFEQDDAAGHIVCVNCGKVSSSQIIVNDQQFTDSGQAVGVLIDQEGNAVGNNGFGSRSSTTIAKVRHAINRYGHILSVPQPLCDAALEMFTRYMSQRRINQMNVKGLRPMPRGKSLHSAFLYIECRKNSTSHMMIDFIDLLKLDPTKFFTAYNGIILTLKHIHLVSHDPTLYIPRFAAHLKLGDMENDCIRLASRIVKRMEKDYISTGRRPSGLCGGALIVACRLYGIPRRYEDVSKVVRISLSTIRKRLREFGSTSSAALTANEFKHIDIEESNDPPSFKQSVDLETLTNKLENNKQFIETLKSDILNYKKSIDKELEQVAKKDVSTIVDSSNEVLSDLVLNDSDYKELSEYFTQAEKNLLGVVELKNDVDDDGNLSDDTQSIISNDSEIAAKIEKVEQLCIEKEERSLKKEKNREEEIDKLIDVDEMLNDQLNKSLLEHEMNRRNEKNERFNETFNCVNPGANSDGELDLTGIDDEELDKFICNKHEMTMKAKMFFKLHKDFICQENERRKRKKELEEYRSKRRRNDRGKRRRTPSSKMEIKLMNDNSDLGIMPKAEFVKSDTTISIDVAVPQIEDRLKSLINYDKIGKEGDFQWFFSQQ